MLDELIVSNLGIIEDAHLEPGAGFVVVTGETGAGKTMLLGALRLLMGASGRKELVGPGDEEAVVDGRFVFGSDEVTLRRRLTREGRSKAYVDGSMVPARALQERTAGKIEVVGQHDHMLLASPAGARLLIDGALTGAGERTLTSYAEAWQALVLVRQKLELLGGGRREIERELEVATFQAEEIDASGFVSGDEEDLRSRADRLRNAEDLAMGFSRILDSLGDDGAAAHLASAAGELGRLAALDSGLRELAERLDTVSAELGEIQLEVGSVAADLEHEPGELDVIEERIAELGKLKRKYGDTLEDVLEFGAAAAGKVTELSGLLGTADDLAQQLLEAELRTRQAAAALTKQRQRTAKSVADRAVGHLIELGMAAPVVRFDFEAAEPGPTGADRIELTFASDRGLMPGPATKVASGGELSRLTLALRLATGIEDADLLAFDEVDAGIGGATALAMGEKLQALSEGRQLFCVTHLPQVAAYADTHYVVLRTGSLASVRQVDGAARLSELSRMLGGLADSERGQLHAAELLAAAQRG